MSCTQKVFGYWCRIKSKIILDYWTAQGFCVLPEREWLRVSEGLWVKLLREDILLMGAGRILLHSLQTFSSPGSCGFPLSRTASLLGLQTCLLVKCTSLTMTKKHHYLFLKFVTIRWSLLGLWDFGYGAIPVIFPIIYPNISWRRRCHSWHIFLNEGHKS